MIDFLRPGVDACKHCDVTKAPPTKRREKGYGEQNEEECHGSRVLIYDIRTYKLKNLENRIDVKKSIINN